MKRALKITQIDGNAWRAEMETLDGRPFVVTVYADCRAAALEKAMQTEPDAA